MAKPATKPPADPPPRWALRCPRRDKQHASIFVRNRWFYCDACDEFTDHSPRLYFVRDVRDGRLIAHPEFVERWGTYVYHGRR